MKDELIFWILIGIFLMAVGLLLIGSVTGSTECKAKGGVYVDHKCLATKELK